MGGFSFRHMLLGGFEPGPFRADGVHWSDIDFNILVIDMEVAAEPGILWAEVVHWSDYN